MRLDEFEWSRNPRGMHIDRILVQPLNYDRFTQPNFGWVKLLAFEAEYLDDAEDFLSMGITPYLRIYRPRWGARPLDRIMRDQLRAYASAGVRWFEFYNEPNLGIEWPEGTAPDWRNYDTMIRPLMDNWLDWAEYVISLDGYPGFIPLAESADLPFAAVPWMDAFLTYMFENHYQRFRDVLASGGHCATHPYIFNHFYQQVPGGGPLTARPPETQNAEEPGWHFEYPYDPISQANDPGRTVYGGTPLTPNGDPVGLIAVGRMFNERCADMFGTQAIPVVGTEGGIWPFNDDPGRQYQQDNRYPPYNTESQAEATVAMFEWIARQAPPWFFGVCLWKEDLYYDRGIAPAIDRLREIPPVYKNVPPLPVMADGYTPSPQSDTLSGSGVGPGPIRGQADFHMIILAPGVEPHWFFDTAQAYWNRFRPIVTTLPELIGFVPNTQSLAATVISSPDTIDFMTQQIRGQYPNVWFDLLVTDDLSNVRDVFNSRVRVNRRFG